MSLLPASLFTLHNDEQDNPGLRNGLRFQIGGAGEVVLCEITTTKEKPDPQPAQYLLVFCASKR